MSKSTKLTIGILLVALIALTFAAGYQLGVKTSPTPEQGLDTIKQAWDIIFTDYVAREKIDSANLTRSAIEGMIEALDDPYTSYLSAQDYKLGMSRLEGEFDGIGAQVSIKDNQLTVIAPIPGSPAEKAGIKAGDIILEIDGKPTSEMSLAEAVLKIRGARGTPVKLVILRQGQTEPEPIELVRALIEVSSVRFEMRDDIAYIHIIQFTEQTNIELSAALQTVLAEKPAGIILDLRMNPGGLLDIVVQVASHFLKEGVVASMVSNEGKVTFNVRNAEPTTDLPMVVLVDSFSASGSEVLAGALQDHKRATIAGTTTFGKGSVNILRQLNDGSGIYITSARWLTPDGRLIEGKGIDPDIKLEPEGEDAIKWAIDYLKGKPG